ncbi:MAG TPA: hypothetical protein VF230_01575 [Acidimicrobiales bacterium]
METFLAGAAAVVVTVTAVTIAAVAIGIHLLRLRNRVSPAVPSMAPLHWMWSVRLAARLHRRLQGSVAAVRLAIAPTVTSGLGLGLDDVAAELEGRAVELDRQLVVASRAASRSRTRMLRELGAEVRELEAIGERTVRLTRAWAGAEPSERGLAAVRDRLDALEGALRELDGIEQLPELEPDIEPRAVND